MDTLNSIFDFVWFVIVAITLGIVGFVALSVLLVFVAATALLSLIGFTLMYVASKSKTCNRILGI